MRGGLWPFLVRRVLMAVPVLFVVATLTFVIIRLVPGGPFDKEKSFPPAIMKNIEARYGLNKPWHEQYLHYMGMIATGDLGPSLKYRSRRVNDIISETFWVSAKLGAWAFLFTIFVGLIAGTWAGLRPGRVADKGGMFFATLGISTPSFVLATLFIMLFSVKLGWLPAALWEGPSSVVLPAIALGFGPAAYIARLVRSSVIEVSEAPHVIAGKARGLPRMRLIIKYILSGALPPVITILGPLLAILVTGSFVIEYIFAIPGMGKYFITAVTDRDYPMIMGVTLVYTALIVVANILVDVLYVLMDPRTEVQ